MLDKIGEKIFKMKYAINDKETWEGACLRVASYIASAEKVFGKEEEAIKEEIKEFFNLMYNLVFLPGGRTLANAGTGIKNLMNCYVLPVDDSREGIYETLKNAAEIFSQGGGIGYNFSQVREEGAEISSTGGKASGPLSFMTLYDQTAEVIQQASRRGAQMGILNIDHPDIEHFINFKSTPNDRNKRMLEEYHRNLSMVNGSLKGTKYEAVLSRTLLEDQLTHFNVSVGINDEFMHSSCREGEFNLISRKTGQPVKTVNSTELLAEMANRAWESGDPGVFFLDRANDDNMVPYIGTIEATNPCVTGDTQILTVYEGPKSFKELVDRGVKEILVFSWDPNTKLPVVRMMSDPRVTRKSVPVWKVTFDSGLELKCTPDHKLYTYMGEKKEVRELLVGQSIRAFSISKHRSGHLRANAWRDGKSYHQYVARMVWEYFNGKVPEEMIIHHADFNKTNNDINNLYLLDNSSHAKIHHDFLGNHKIIAIEEMAELQDVYNGTVGDTHTYIIADSITSHGVYSGIVSANCGEVPLLPYESCCLGSLNLHKFYNQEDKQIDFPFLEYAVRKGIRFLDNVQELSETGIPEVDTMTKGLRRLGLGVMGLADLLSELELPYDSEEAKRLQNYISWFISFFAWQESMLLAEERGTFPLYDKEKVNMDVVKNVLHSPYVPNEMKFDVANLQVRNISVTSIAPTGSIALLAGVNSSIEPYFALAYRRNITEGVGNTAIDHVIEINRILFQKLGEAGFTAKDIDEVKEYILEYGTITGFEKISGKLREAFRTSHEINWKDHIDAQAMWQEYVTNAVSKTINCPNDTTKEDIIKMYRYMWESDLKGGTIYRDGSKTFQILNMTKPS